MKPIDLDALTAQIDDLRGSVTNIVASTQNLAVIADNLTHHFERLLKQVEQMAKLQIALTTKVCEIERKVYNLPDNVTVLRPDS